MFVAAECRQINRDSLEKNDASRFDTLADGNTRWGIMVDRSRMFELVSGAFNRSNRTVNLELDRKGCHAMITFTKIPKGVTP